ncbi:Beta-1,3-galactosyltransferase 4 [Araneus ventricosus]|uniref:Hexosyltransferase n=1 Tax=Araneus ventricosus TaxID=182803 RepID=A0A4Y2R8J4_ARAVE|nr:Beta-1,3-galactosyltransferase 4 [Araneus ventricosus]
MPRKAIATLMLVMAILTIFSFISIEIRRIIWLKNLVKQKDIEIEHYKDAYEHAFNTTFKTNASSLETASNVTNKILFRSTDWNAEIVDGILSENPLCSPKLFLLILVASAPENFEQRDAIRKTWADPENKNSAISGLKTKTVFLIGRSSSRFLNALLKSENEVYNDILSGDYLDTYRNLTLKVVHGLRWASSHCQPSYTMKTDDDCFVNVPLLLHFLWKQNPIETNLYAGHVRWTSPVIRNPNNTLKFEDAHLPCCWMFEQREIGVQIISFTCSRLKERVAVTPQNGGRLNVSLLKRRIQGFRWYVSESDFQGSRFVPYVNGAGYVLSLDVLRKFAKFSGVVKLFPNEDAFVGTVLNMAGIRPTYSARFVAHSAAWQMCNFLYLFVVHHVKPVRQFEFQKLADKAWEECSLTDMAHDWV